MPHVHKCCVHECAELIDCTIPDALCLEDVTVPEPPCCPEHQPLFDAWKECAKAISTVQSESQPQVVDTLISKVIHLRCEHSYHQRRTDISP